MHPRRSPGARTGPDRRTRRLSRALRNPHRPSHRSMPHLRRPYGPDRPLAADVAGATRNTALRHVMTLRPDPNHSPTSVVPTLSVGTPRHAAKPWLAASARP